MVKRCLLCGQITGHGPHVCPSTEPLPTRKRCCDCKKQLPLSGFHRNNGKDTCRVHRASRCKECQSKYARAWRIRNRRKLQDVRRLHRLRNPDRYAFWKIKHRARKFGASCELTFEEYIELRSRPCAYCGRAAGTIDHMVPLERGGAHDCTNCVSACRSCNYSKKKLTPLEWFLSKRPGVPRPSEQKQRAYLTV